MSSFDFSDSMFVHASIIGWTYSAAGLLGTTAAAFTIGGLPEGDDDTATTTAAATPGAIGVPPLDRALGVRQP